MMWAFVEQKSWQDSLGQSWQDHHALDSQDAKRSLETAQESNKDG